MANLLKLAGYQNDEAIEKIAEAMDYLEANGVDPIGGLVTLSLTDEDGNVLDEKVASVVESELTPEQSAALVEVAEFLGGVDEDMIKVAEEISAGAADLMDKVAEYATYVEEAGMPFEDAMILASSIYEDGSVDEKVASEAVELGYTDEHLEFAEKVAEAIYAETGLTPEEALEIAKEAASIKGAVDSTIEGAKKLYTGDIKNMAKKAWGSYKAAITGKGADNVSRRLRYATQRSEAAKNLASKEREKGKAAYEKIVGSAKKVDTKKASKLGSKAQYRHEQQAKKWSSKARQEEERAKEAKKSLGQIRKRQALAIGGTAAGAGAVGYGTYRAVAGNKDK